MRLRPNYGRLVRIVEVGIERTQLISSRWSFKSGSSRPVAILRFFTTTYRLRGLKLQVANASFLESQFQTFADPSAVIHHGQHRARSGTTAMRRERLLRSASPLTACLQRVTAHSTRDHDTSGSFWVGCSSIAAGCSVSDGIFLSCQPSTGQPAGRDRMQAVCENKSTAR